MLNTSFLNAIMLDFNIIVLPLHRILKMPIWLSW